MSFIRRVAATSAIALAASSLGVVAAQPATAADGATLTWSFSDYLFNPDRQLVGFTSHEERGGATASAEGIVFADGQATGSLEGGDLHVTYAGGVDFTWHATIGFSDPEIIVEGDQGRIVADVNWATPDTGSAEDLVLTTFDPATAAVVPDGFSATPDWSTGSWAPEFVNALPESVRAFFHTTGSSSDARKAPATFTATTAATPAGPGTTATSSYADGAVTIAVAGTGFDPVYDPATREDGVYVTLAPAGAFPETDDFEDQDKVPATTWVMNSQIRDGAFEATLAPPSRLLDPRRDYAIYTWQAHGHTNTASDTETAVALDFSRIGKATKLKAAKQGKRLVVTVGKGAAGKVAVKLTKGAVTKRAAAAVRQGVATVRLPAAKGAWKAVVSYTPSKANYRAAKKTFTVRVR